MPLCCARTDPKSELAAVYRSVFFTILNARKLSFMWKHPVHLDALVDLARSYAAGKPLLPPLDAGLAVGMRLSFLGYHTLDK